MKHLSWKYRRRRNAQEQREFSAAQRRRVEARWRKVHAEQSGTPIRTDRVVQIVIVDSHRPRTTLTLTQTDCRGRWHGIGQRSIARAGVARLLADFLR
jgi:hypothetical protein